MSGHARITYSILKLSHEGGMDQTSLFELARTVERESREGALLTQNPCDNPICALRYNEEVRCIEVVWHKYATSAQLRYTHEIILMLLAQHKAEKILGDDTDLPIIHAEDQRWIIENWLPRARAAGLKAAASAVSMSFFGKVAIGSVQSRISRDIPIKNFGTIHSARSWLKGFLPGINSQDC